MPRRRRPRYHRPSAPRRRLRPVLEPVPARTAAFLRPRPVPAGADGTAASSAPETRLSRSDRTAAARTADNRSPGRSVNRSSRTRASSSRTCRASPSRAQAIATPGRPSAIRASRPDNGGVATPRSARIVSISRTGTGPSRSRAQRDRMVGSSGSSASAHRMSVTPAGGSSSVFRSAAWASSFIRWASRMMATRAPPSTGRSASSPSRSRMPGTFEPGPPMTTCRPGPSAPTPWTSG